MNSDRDPLLLAPETELAAAAIRERWSAEERAFRRIFHLDEPKAAVGGMAGWCPPRITLLPIDRSEVE